MKIHKNMYHSTFNVPAQSHGYNIVSFYPDQEKPRKRGRKIVIFTLAGGSIKCTGSRLPLAGWLYMKYI